MRVERPDAVVSRLRPDSAALARLPLRLASSTLAPRPRLRQRRQLLPDAAEAEVVEQRQGRVEVDPARRGRRSSRWRSARARRAGPTRGSAGPDRGTSAGSPSASRPARRRHGRARPPACRTVRAVAGRTSARSAARPARCRPNRPPGPGNRPPARGAIPHSACSVSRSKTSFLRMLKTFTRSVINCRQSLSPVTRKHWPPSSSVTRATVARTSSASNDSQPSAGMPRAAITRRMAGICGTRSSCISGPLDLVLVVHRVAKGLAGQVERAEQVVRLLLLQQVEQIAGEAEHGPHRLALRAGHLRQGVKDLMDQRMGVDDPDRLAGQR